MKPTPKFESPDPFERGEDCLRQTLSPSRPVTEERVARAPRIEREKLKKLAEERAKNVIGENMLWVEASTILALLSELEQAERERDAAIEMQCKLEADLDEQDQAVARLQAAVNSREAALRTLREASQPCRIWLEAIALDYPEGSVVRSKSQNLSDALAAALATEGGK